MNERKDIFTRKIFFRLWTPAIVSSVGLAMGDIADAVVVGQRMGTTGLAAISLSLPIYMIINVVMHSLGVGGSVRFSKLLGEGKEKEAVSGFNGVLLCSLVLGILLAVSGIIFLEPVLKILGTVPEDGALYINTRKYVHVIIAGIPCFFAAYILNYYLRNDNKQKLAAVGFTVANAFDIILNIVFVLVFDMGAFGAALSTVIGQVVAIAIYLPGLTGKHGFLKLAPCLPKIKEVTTCFVNGFSVAVQYICQLVFLLICNRVLMHKAGEAGVAVFDMIQNVSYLVLYLFDGTVKAIQPIVSTYCGEYNEEGKKRTKQLGLRYGMFVGGLMIVLIFIFPQSMCMLFGLTGGVATEIGRTALRIYVVGAVFAGISIVLEGYYQACESEKEAFLLTTLRGTIVLLPCCVLFSLLSITGFWLLFPVTELLSLFIFMLWKKKKGSEEMRDIKIYNTVVDKFSDLSAPIQEVEAFCEECDGDMKQIYFVTMTMEEVCLAIMNQAFSGKKDEYIEITLIAKEDGEFELHIRDNAEKFNPFAMKMAKAKRVEDVDLDSMGMLVIKEKSKYFFYRQYQGFNTLVIRI